MSIISLRNSILIFILFVSLHALGQSTLQYPTDQSQFFNTYAFINPASTGAEGKLALRIGEQINAGYFSRVRTLLALTEVAFKTKSEKSHHALGLAVMTNKEGNLISFNRVYFQYAFHLAISTEWKLAAGISTGFLNLAIDQTATSGSVSSFAPDGSFGFYLYRNKERIGFSDGQMLNRSIQVINEVVPIRRFYTFFYSRSLILSPTVKFIPSFICSLRKEGQTADLNMSMLLQDLVFVGLSYRYQKGSAYFVGLRDLIFLGGLCDFTVSYNAPWPAPNLGNIQTFELILSFKIKSMEAKGGD